MAKRIMILKAGELPASAKAKTGGYCELLRKGIGPAFDYQEIDVRCEALPAAPSNAALIITGSDSSVYGEDAWITELAGWLRQVDPALPIVGICFGHQLLAQIYGGKVERASVGPQIGLFEYEACPDPIWRGIIKFALPAWHYDQVVGKPADADVVAFNPSCQIAALKYRKRRMLSLQAHPELPLSVLPDLAKAWKVTEIINSYQMKVCINSIDINHHDREILEIIRIFIKG